MQRNLILLSIVSVFLAWVCFEFGAIGAAAQEAGVAPPTVAAEENNAALRLFNAQSNGAAAALVIAASLALQSALGPTMNSIVGAIKSTGWFAADRTGQAISLVLGTGLGTLAGWLAMNGSGTNDPIWLGIGAFTGLIGPGVGGVRSKTMIDGHIYDRLAGSLSGKSRSDPIIDLYIAKLEDENTLIVEKPVAPEIRNGGIVRRRAVLTHEPYVADEPAVIVR